MLDGDDRSLAPGLAWMLVAVVVFLVAGVNSNYLLGGLALFGGGIGTGLFGQALRVRLKPAPHQNLLAERVEEVRAELQEVLEQIDGLRAERDFDRALGEVDPSRRE